MIPSRCFWNARMLAPERHRSMSQRHYPVQRHCDNLRLEKAGFAGMSSRIETFLGRHFTAICLLGIAAALFAFVSFKPTYRLRPEMPHDFVGTGLPSTVSAGEVRLARAYWDSAMLRIQGKYAY